MKNGSAQRTALIRSFPEIYPSRLDDILKQLIDSKLIYASLDPNSTKPGPKAPVITTLK